MDWLLSTIHGEVDAFKGSKDDDVEVASTAASETPYQVA